MKSLRTTMVCVVYDTLIAAKVGVKTAQAFDWLYSFLHLNESRTGEIWDGRKWGAFTYKQLADKSNALPNEHAWKRALAELQEEGLIFTDTVKGLGKYYAINFAKVREIVGEKRFEDGYEKDLEKQIQEIPKWMDETPPLPRPKEENRKKKTTTPQSKTLSPNPEQSTPTTQSKTLRLPRAKHSDTQSKTLRPAYIYRIDSSSIRKRINSTLPNGSGVAADLPIVEEKKISEELPPPADTFSAIARTIYPGLVLDEDMRKTVARVIRQIQQTQIYVGKGQREKPLLDPMLIEDYGIWRMLISDTGRNGFPSVQEFIDEFRFQFFKWYWTPSNRAPIERIKAEFSDWRTRLYTGDYVQFRRDVQARVMRTAIPTRPTGGKGGSPLARTPEQLEKAWGRRSSEKKDET